jgi:copper homeostasis protein (lipoprotein)
MKRHRLVMAIVTPFLLAQTAFTQEKGGRLGTLPASFRGDLPCADCPGIRYTLDLFPGGSVFTRMIYLERNVKPVDGVGRWVLSSDGSKLTLTNGKGSTGSFAVKSGGILRQLDMQGNEIQSKLNYDLRRTKAFEFIDVSLEMEGMLKYSDDVGTFTECRSGQSWRVTAEGEYEALHSAYLASTSQSGSELMASIEGQVVMRRAPDGKGADRTLIVRREIGMWPGEGCGSADATTNLQNTYWKLTRLEGVSVVPGAQQREPNLVFRTEQKRVTGSGGCNVLNGGYTLAGNQITLDRVASTMMACVNGSDVELKFLKALETVRTWKILGQHLQLYAADGSTVAQFEAGQPK